MISDPSSSVNDAKSLIDKQGWNEYWSKKKPSGGRLYDLIAEFYRKFLIRPSLNHFILKTFKEQAKILHAGCGSGQVDADIRHKMQISGLDISTKALEIYERENKGLCNKIHGSIFSIPSSDGAFDGVYNLGVMEHFDEGDIARILSEFHRVLKTNGRLVLFWPPEFGLSVLFFKFLKPILEFFMRRTVKIHPDEICRIRSKKHAAGLLEASSFRVVETYFGVKDFFTYYVIVAEKV